MGNSDTDPVPPQILANLPAAVRFVPNHAPWATFGTSRAAALDRAAFHQGFEGHSLVPLARRQHHRHEFATSFRADVDFGAEAALTAP